MKARYNVYIDGSCLNIGSENSTGGWAFVVVDNKTDVIIEEQFGKIESGINNSIKAELESLYQALLWIKKNKHKKDNFHIVTDHEVIVGSMEGECKRAGSRGYWNIIEPVCLELVGHISISHIKSHVNEDVNRDNIYNNICDKLAKKGANSLLLKAIPERKEY